MRKGKREQLRLNSLDFKNYISYEHYNAYGYCASENAIRNVIRYFCGAAIGSSLIEQATRIAERNGKIHYDLHNDQMEVVIVDKEGWKISKNNDIYFKQSANIFEQVKPISNNRNIIDLLRPYINLDEEEELLFIVYLVSCFILGIQHPIMNITGGKGTGKSTMLSIMKKL